MKLVYFSFKEANQNLIWVLLIGFVLGIANYALGSWPSLGQSLIQQMIISLVIGYSLLLISFNTLIWFSNQEEGFRKYSALLILFCLVGVLGSEIEAIVKRFVFQQGEYHPCNAGGIYLFNAILSSVLGFMTYTWVYLKQNQKDVITLQDTIEVMPEKLSNTIPIKQGDAITLHSLQEVTFFEAYDNYSFLHDLESNRILCNYSLSFLENKLETNFLRIHRKYIINKNHIHQVKPTPKRKIRSRV